MRTIKSVQAELRPLGIVLRRVEGEWRVNYRGGSEQTAYYTMSLEDARATGIFMAEEATMIRTQ